MPINPKSVKNLHLGAAAKEPRTCITPTILPRTQASLKETGLTLGEAIDVAEFARANIGLIQSGQVSQKNDGPFWSVDLSTDAGVLSALCLGGLAVQRWSIYWSPAQDLTLLYFAGRFNRKQLMRLFSADSPTLSLRPLNSKKQVPQIPAAIDICRLAGFALALRPNQPLSPPPCKP
jgi:hypothetical protein